MINHLKITHPLICANSSIISRTASADVCGFFRFAFKNSSSVYFTIYASMVILPRRSEIYLCVSVAPAPAPSSAVLPSGRFVMSLSIISFASSSFVSHIINTSLSLLRRYCRVSVVSGKNRTCQRFPAKQVLKTLPYFYCLKCIILLSQNIILYYLGSYFKLQFDSYNSLIYSIASSICGSHPSPSSLQLPHRKPSNHLQLYEIIFSIIVISSSKKLTGSPISSILYLYPLYPASMMLKIRIIIWNIFIIIYANY